MPYKLIRRANLDERKIIILNQSLENHITDELLKIGYLWISVCIKTSFLALFLALSLFVGLCTEHLYLLKAQKIVVSSVLVKKNIKNLISIDNVLLLPYDRRGEDKVSYSDKNSNEYSVLAKVQLQLEIDNYNKTISQFKEQEQYIKDMMAVILSSMTYQKILQEKSKVTLKISIKNKINRFLSRGRVKEVHNINIMYL